jgi:hypothetical protein
MKLRMMSYALAATLIVGIPLIGHSVDSTTTTDSTTATELYSGPPVVEFSLSKQETPVITVNGLLPEAVEGFTWNGVDISSLVSSLIDSGAIQQTTRTDGFDLAIGMDIRQLAGKNEFGVVYRGNKLSATMDSNTLLASAQARAMGNWTFSGTVYYKSASCWYYWACGKKASGASVTVTVGKSSFMGISTKTTTANSNGYYSTTHTNDACTPIKVTASYNGKSNTVSTSQYFCGNKNIDVYISG